MEFKKIPQGILFPAIRADQIETILYNFSMKWSVFISIFFTGFYIAYLLTTGEKFPENFMQNVLFLDLIAGIFAAIFISLWYFRKFSANKNNSLLFESPNTSTTDLAINGVKMLLVCAISLVFFLVFYSSHFPLKAFNPYAIIFILLSSYFFAGPIGLLGAQIFEVLVKIYNRR